MVLDRILAERAQSVQTEDAITDLEICRHPDERGPAQMNQAKIFAKGIKHHIEMTIEETTEIHAGLGHVSEDGLPGETTGTTDITIATQTLNQTDTKM